MTKIAFTGDCYGDLGWGLAYLETAKSAGAALLIQTGDFGTEWPEPAKLFNAEDYRQHQIG